MMKNRTGLVALIVLAAATLLMVFFVLPNMNKEKPAQTPVASLAEKPVEGGGDTKTTDGKQARATSEQPAVGTASSGDAAATAAATQETAKADATPADPTAGWVTPAFDLLRVEPDGSTVIAGRGQPNTRLEIRNGETVVATTDIGPSGDFAAVFDQPLAAGDYQLTLNTKDDKGDTKTSEEVATVSVPKDSSGDLLAMVSRPGEASRLITVPEATQKAAGEAVETAQVTAGEKAGDVAAAAGDVPEAENAKVAATGEEAATQAT
ncbi:MAG: LysM peptidoglycan-binding domain-containing protein, partial [Shinella sp.]